MSFNLRNRNRLGPRFGEKIGKLAHAAITAANRNNRAKYDALVQEIQQMLDTIDTETWGHKPNEDTSSEDVTPVAATSEQAEAPAVPAKKAAAPKNRTAKPRASSKAKSES